MKFPDKIHRCLQLEPSLRQFFLDLCHVVSARDIRCSSDESHQVCGSQLRGLELSLTVQWDSQQQRKTESLRIVQSWADPPAQECFTLTDVYVDLKDWLVEEVLGYAALLGDDAQEAVERIKGIQGPDGIPAYQHRFALDLSDMVYGIEHSSFRYETTSVGRGVQSLASLVLARSANKVSQLDQLYAALLHHPEVSQRMERLGLTKPHKVPKLAQRLAVHQAFLYTKSDASRHVWESSSQALCTLCSYYASSAAD